MKYLLLKLALTGALLLMASVSQAQFLSGWQTSVTASNGSALQTINVLEGTKSLCDSARLSAIFSLNIMGFTTLISAPPCTSTAWNVPKKIIWERIPDPREIPRDWPPGPVCLSCPYLNKTVLELIYPENFERALKIVEQYNIQGYNKAVMELQEAYQLESFEKEMFQFELEQRGVRSR